MKITRRQITQIINEELRLVAEAEKKKKKNKQKVTANGDESREDAWAGGDNLVDPNDWEKTLDMIKEQNSDTLSPEELHNVIFEELSAVLAEVTHPFPVYEAEGGTKFTDENGESWNVDCKTKWAMSCGDGCSAKQFSNFSKGDQKKLGEMCSINESKGQSRHMSQRDLRQLIEQVAGGEEKELVNRSVENQIKKALRAGAKADHVINFFKHLGTHGEIGWDAQDLQGAVQNMRMNNRMGAKIPFEYIWWLTRLGHAEAKTLENSLTQAQGFHDLNDIILGMGSDALYWKGHGKPPPDEETRNSQRVAMGLKPTKVTKITRGEEKEEDISDEEMMDRWGKPEEEE